MANPTYTDARYTFTAPNENRKYIWTLAVIAEFNAEGMLPDRALVAANLHEPLPNRIVGYDNYWKKNVRSNWGNSRWNALRQAGLITSWRSGNAVHYAITPKGIKLLALARDKSTAMCGGSLVSNDGQRKAGKFVDCAEYVYR